jgi:hypothetical protein
MQRCPRQVLVALKHFGSRLCVGGGYVRACVANEPINDVDLFVDSVGTANEVALYLIRQKLGQETTQEEAVKHIHKTDNALTLRGFKLPVQIIHRWTFRTPIDAMESFDFTIARAVFWWNNSQWTSACAERFYQDLAAKRLVYTAPVRNEDAGGSMLRVLKYYQKGYRIPIDSYAAVIARMMRGVDFSNSDLEPDIDDHIPERPLAYVLTGLLREVDPSIDPSHIAHLPAEDTRD